LWEAGERYVGNVGAAVLELKIDRKDLGVYCTLLMTTSERREEVRSEQLL
jgi:hypothetical protein